jgi:hypothetical protein
MTLPNRILLRLGSTILVQPSLVEPILLCPSAPPPGWRKSFLEWPHATLEQLIFN